MRFIWEEKDIIAGRQIQKPDCGITGRWIIGYRYRDRSSAGNGTCFGLVSLADGMWMDVEDGTALGMVSWLNQTDCYDPVDLR